jgi:hypothetical protein
MSGRISLKDSILRDVLLLAAVVLASLCMVHSLEGQNLPDSPSSVKAENRAFWVAVGIDYAATFADAAVSSHAHYQPGLGHCHETNRLYGAPFPSSARLYGQMAAETTALSVGMWFLKRHHHDWFVVPPLVHALLHTVATVDTAHYCL